MQRSPPHPLVGCDQSRNAMSTTPRSRRADPPPEVNRNTAIRWGTDQQRGLLSRRRGPWLLAGLILAVVLWMTDAGGPGLYETVYWQAAKAEHYLVRGPGAPLSLFDPSKARAERFRLQGIVYSPMHPLAVINEVSCAPGEKIAIKLGKDTEIIRCVEVRPGAVQIETADGTIELLQLLLRSEADEPEQSVTP